MVDLIEFPTRTLVGFRINSVHTVNYNRQSTLESPPTVRLMDVHRRDTPDVKKYRTTDLRFSAVESSISRSGFGIVDKIGAEPLVCRSEGRVK